MLILPVPFKVTSDASITLVLLQLISRLPEPLIVSDFEVFITLEVSFVDEITFLPTRTISN